MIKNEEVWINGDGETSRDFTFIDDVVQINLLAATTQNPEALNQVYNVAVGESTSLKELFESLRSILAQKLPHLVDFKPHYRDFRAGDVRHSLASIDKARNLMNYEPTHHIRDGLDKAMAWYRKNLCVD